ncbi:MAG: fibronectin type III domain-containing protein [Blautia sp.]|nr:fibronectin type III domain-containing protein [Blautia sp.]
MKYSRKKQKTVITLIAICALSAPVHAARDGEAARMAYTSDMAEPMLDNEFTSDFYFMRPVDINSDGVAELIVSQLTSRPVIYSYIDGAMKPVYQGNGDGAIMQYYPESGIFAEMSGRMGEYRVWYVSFNGKRARVLFSYSYEGEPMSPTNRDYIFDNYDVTWYKGNSWTGEEISRKRFENLFQQIIGDAVCIPLSSTMYDNTGENREKYILNSPVPTETDPVAQHMDSVENQADGIMVSWKASTNADGYVVYRRQGSNADGNTEESEWSSVEIIDGRDVTSWLDEDAVSSGTEGQLYYYTVRGYIDDTSNQSTEYEKEGLGTARLSAPEIVRCEDAPECMSYVRWTCNEAASGYLVQYSTDPEFENCETAELPDKEADHFTGEGLTDGETYYYRVQAYLKTGDITSTSSFSEPQKMTARQ